MSPIEPNDSGSQVKRPQEGARSFVVARGDGAVLFKSGEEVLDQVTRLLQVAVMAALVLARTDRQNYHGLAGLR